MFIHIWQFPLANCLINNVNLPNPTRSYKNLIVHTSFYQWIRHKNNHSDMKVVPVTLIYMNFGFAVSYSTLLLLTVMFHIMFPQPRKDSIQLLQERRILP